MKIEAVVRPLSKHEEIVCLGDGRFKISVKDKPVDGRANEAVQKLLAEYFKVPKSRVRFLQGLKSKIKRLEVLE